MQVTNFAQPGPGVQAPVANNTAVNGNTEQLSNSVAPAADTLSITSSKIMIATQLVTQQVAIALEIKAPVSNTSHQTSDDTENQTDQLVNKIVQKIHDEKASNTDEVSEDEKHSAAVKSVRVKVAQGFESASLALSRSGAMDGAVADNVAQTRARVDAAIDQVAGQPTTAAVNEAPVASVETAAVNMVSAKREQATSLQLTTREGDVVTVNFSRSQAMSAGSVQGGGGSLAYAGSASSSMIAVSVQGDISESESKSIRKVVESINNLADKLFNGKTGAAMEKLGELNINTEYLATMSLSMSSSFSYQAVSAYAQVSRLPAEGAAPAQMPASGALAATPAPTASTVNNNSQLSSVAAAPAQLTTPAASAEPASSAAAPVVREAATVVNDAVTADAFENPFDAIRNLFAQMADMFASAQNNVTDKHKDFVSELFDAVVDKAEDDHDEKKDGGNDVDDLAA